MIIYKQPLQSSAIEDDPDTAKALPKDSVLKLLSEDFWEKVEALHELLSKCFYFYKVEALHEHLRPHTPEKNALPLDLLNATE